MLKNFVKNTFMILLLFFVTISFSGFNSINSWVAQDKDGHVCEWITVELDETSIEGAGQTVNAVANQINVLASNHINAMKYEATNPNDIQMALGGLNDNVYTCGIVFRSEEVYDNFYSGTEFGNKQTVEEHFLYSKIINTRYSVFAKHQEFYLDLLNNLPGEVKVSFSLQTQFRRSHSDADSVKKVDNIYTHSWDINENNLLEPVMVYYNVINSGTCILLCVAISVVVCLVVFIVGLIKCKFSKNKKKTLKNN